MHAIIQTYRLAILTISKQNRQGFELPAVTHVDEVSYVPLDAVASYTLFSRWYLQVRAGGQ